MPVQVDWIGQDRIRIIIRIRIRKRGKTLFYGSAAYAVYKLIYYNTIQILEYSSKLYTIKLRIRARFACSIILSEPKLIIHCYNLHNNTRMHQVPVRVQCIHRRDGQ